MNRWMSLLVVTVSLLLVSASLRAQFAQRGSIEGTVFDSTGAAVPSAQLNLLDIAQNQSRKIAADAEGHFEFDNLAAGQYRLTATTQGFQTEISEPITVNIGAITNYNFSLRAGNVQQTITVTDEAVGLETDQISVATDVSEKQFEDLPLNGRNFTAVAALVPGVATTPQLNINPGGTWSIGAMFAMGGTFYTAGGSFQGSRDNGFYLNGVNISDAWVSSIGYQPSAEALTTGTVSVTDFSAANGHDLTAMTMQTKGGSSSFHGEAFEFFQNDALNAINPFDEALSPAILGVPATKPTLRRNQFGGNVGGPVFIPKLLPGLRKRVFFFANYENFIEHDGSEPFYGSVPSAAESTGDFSELLTGPSPLQLYNPYYTTYDANGYSTRPAIPNNRLDLATRPDGSPLIDPGSAAILKLWPGPNISDTPSYEPNYYTNVAPGFSVYHVDTRFDATISSKDSLFATWSQSRGAQTQTGGLTPFLLNTNLYLDTSKLVTVNYAHVFNPRLTNEFIFGWSLATLGQDPGEIAQLASDSNPLNSLFQNVGSGTTTGEMAVNVYNYATEGPNESGGAAANTKGYQFSDNLDWIKGRHALSMGFAYLWKGEGLGIDVSRFASFGEGSYWFGFPRQEFSSGGYDENYAGGDGMADLVMGIPGDLHQAYTFTGFELPKPFAWSILPYWSLYVDDKFHLTPKLMISGGLRYDLPIPMFNDIGICCAVYSPTADGGVMKLPGFALPQHYINAPKEDFAPRVSIAYSPVPKWTVRTGYGIFYDAGATQMSYQLNNQLGEPAETNSLNDMTNVTQGYPSDTPGLTLSQVLPPQIDLQVGQYPVSTGKGEGYFGDGLWDTVAYNDQKSTAVPYFQRYLLDLQHLVAAHDTLTVSYVGVQGRKGTNGTNINLAPYATGWATQDAYNAARPNNFGRFGDIYVERPTVNSHYNAVIAEYRHDFSKGFQFMSNYTLGKTVSDYPWFNTISENGALGGVSGFQYPNIHNRGESTFSHRQRFVYSGIWNPQYGKAWSGWAKVPLTGWRISGIGTLESGDTYTIVNVETTAADYAGLDEMSVSGNPNLSHGKRTFINQFDTSKFSLPPNGVRGNSGLGTIRGPGQNNVDLSLAKTFSLYESLHLEFRADAFNAFNHTQWNSVQTIYPNASVGNYGNLPFGQVAGAREARIGQVSAKVVF